MRFLTITGRVWRELPLVMLLGLVIGGVFGELVKLIPPQAATVTTKAKR
jgi:hypothetical protein